MRVVLLHSALGDSRLWRHQVEALSGSFEVVAPDLPGFGSTPMPRKEFSFVELVDRHLPAAVVGNSMGGHVACELAIRSPQRVERLMLVSAAGISAELVQRDAVMTGGRVVAAVMTRAAAQRERSARRPGMRRITLSFVVRHADRLSAPLAHELMSGSGKPGFLPALEAVLTHRISERLPEIACPTLVLWGEDDRVIPVRDADRFAALIPDVRVEIWPDTGHVAMLERPEAFNALLEAFLAEQPPSRPPQGGPAHAPTGAAATDRV